MFKFKVDENGELKAVDRLTSIAPNFPDKITKFWPDFVFYFVAGETDYNILKNDINIGFPAYSILKAHFERIVNELQYKY